MGKTTKKILFSTFIYTFVLMLMFGSAPVKAQTTGGFDQSLLTTDLTLFNSNFESFRVDFLDMKILDEVGNPITRDNVPLKSTQQTWIDPLHQFPKIQVTYSQPFLTNDFFNEIPDDLKQLYLAKYEPTNKMQISDQDSGKIYYLKQYDLAFDVGVQTFANFNPNKQYYNLYISPFDNMEHNHRERTDFDSMDKSGSSSQSAEPNRMSDYDRSINRGNYDMNVPEGWEHSPDDYENDAEPQGILGGWVGTGGSPSWNVYWINEGNPAALKQSLEAWGDNRWGGNNWEISASGRPVWDGIEKRSLSDVDNAFKSAQPVAPNKDGKWDYGNRNCIVRPRLQLTALSQFLKGFDYTTKKIINGVEVEIRVQTTSAKIGIYRALDAGNQFKLMGLVNNEFNQDLIKEKYHSVVPSPQGSKQINDLAKATGDLIPQTQPPGFTTYTLTASLKQIPSLPDRDPYILQGTTDPGPFRDITLPTVNQIDIPNFDQSVPTSFVSTGDFQVAPVTSVNHARYKVNYATQFLDKNGLLGLYTEDVKTSGSFDVEYPYKMNLDNVFGVRRLGFRVAVLTENSADVVVANGRPIRVEDFREFNVNSLGELVSNEMEAKLEVTEFSWLDLFGDIFSNPLFIIIVIGVIVVVILVAVLSGRRRQSYGFMSPYVGGDVTAAARPSFFRTPAGKFMIYLIVGLVIALVVTIVIVAVV